MKPARRARTKKKSQANLESSIAQLENAQLVRPADEEDRSYLFKHTLTQETAYGSLLFKTRQKVHRLVARSYESLYPERLDEFAALLAQHYGEAADDAKTLEYEIRAGDVATRLNAHVEALAHYSHAIELEKRVKAPHLLQELYLKRGRALELRGLYVEALANYQELEQVSREKSDHNMELAALMARATILSVPTTVRDIPAARALCDQALRLARELGDRPAEAKILWNLMLLSSRLELRLTDALAFGEQSLAIARELHLMPQLAYTLNDLATVYASLGQHEHGERVLQEAAVMWKEMNNLPMMADNLGYATMNRVLYGNYQGAITAAQEARRISQEIGNPWGEAFSQLWLGQGYVELGEPAQAIAVMEDAVRLVGESGFVAPLVITRSDLGRLYGDLGQIERGLAQARLALEVAEEQYSSASVWALAAMAHLQVMHGDLSQAEHAVQEGHRVYTLDDSNLRLGSPLHMAEAELTMARGDFERALTALNDLARGVRRLRLREFLPSTLYLMSQALLALHRMDEALAILTEARSMAEEIQGRWMLWRILGSLAEIERQRGNSDPAAQLLAQARDLLEYIAAHTPPDLRESFLQLPAVRAVLHSAEEHA